MIAVYYDTSSSPFTMYVLPNQTGEHHDFLEDLERAQYPFPSADVLFIENDEVVDQWCPLLGLQKDFK
jgi:hypothetical protein